MKSALTLLALAHATMDQPFMNLKVVNRPILGGSRYNQRKARKARRQRNAAGFKNAFSR